MELRLQIFKFICLFFCIYIISGQNIEPHGRIYQYYKKVKYFNANTEISSTIKTILKKTDENILKEGYFCKRSIDNRGGYCLPAYKCLHIIREFMKHGTKIDICSYDRKIPIICCPLEEKDISLKPKRSKRISALKCDEYNKEEENPFPRYRKVHNISKCEASIPLIVGGQITYPGEFPHMAAVGWRKTPTEINWACGGTLISEFFILTAAHCTLMGEKGPEVVKLGEQNLQSTITSQELNIASVIVNPQYKSSSYYHDIALLKLSQKVMFNNFIRPACLWQKSNFNFEHGLAVATGWGRKRFLGPKSNELLKVDLKIIDQNMCKKLYINDRKLPNGIITDYQFCAGHLNGGKDTCQGDSGGPLQTNIIKSKCIYYVVGITSFGKFCAAPNAPGVYTKVYAYLNWIENIVFNST